MPKDNIDYSNTIIYKIYCNDKTISDVYVGHTTNFTKRKCSHKSGCNNLYNKLKIYNIIRQNGGWDNWEMVEIAKYNCKDKTEARIKEQQHYEELNSTLNSCPPCIDKKNFFCNNCNLQCETQKIYEFHINSNKHKNQQIMTQNNYCQKCDYVTCDSWKYNRHILTNKHKNGVKESSKDNKKGGKGANEYEKDNNIFICCCGKQYAFRQGLWKHKKVCNQQVNIKEEVEKESDEILEKKDNNDLIQYLIKENKDLKNLVLEVCKNFQVTNMIKNE